MADGNAPKRVFLRKVLYRIDYQLITEQMQEDIFAFVSQKFGEYFSLKEEKSENSIAIEINPKQIEQSRLNQRTWPVFVFSDPQTPTADGRQLIIGRTFLLLELNLTLESMNIPYYKWMSEIVSFLRQNSMFRASRIGLRKFNSFFILDQYKEELNKLFSIQYLPQIDNDDFNLDSFQEMLNYNYLPYTLKFQKTYSTGNLNNPNWGIENEPAHQIAFDFDLFTTDFGELDEFGKDAIIGLEKMNSFIYKFFISILNPDIVERINKGDLLEDYHIVPF